MNKASYHHNSNGFYTQQNTGTVGSRTYWSRRGTEQLDDALTRFAAKIALGEMTSGSWAVYNAVQAEIAKRVASCTNETQGRYEIWALGDRAARVRALEVA